MYRGSLRKNKGVAGLGIISVLPQAGIIVGG